jgi:hypothetical protein
MTANLILHCGAHRVEREQLANVVTAPATRTFHPIPHHLLLSSVQETLERAGMSVVSEAHGLTRNGARYFGLLEIKDDHAADDFALVVGIRNADDQALACGLAIGSSVLVCDNLAFSGEVKIQRKHTRFIHRDLPGLLSHAVAQLGQLRRTQETRFSTYKTAELTDIAAHDLIVQALDARVIGPMKLVDVLKEWRAPRHHEFREGGKTAWRLFNCFTEILKGNLAHLPRRTQTLHGLLDLHVGLAGTASATTLLPSAPTADVPELATAS